MSDDPATVWAWFAVTFACWYTGRRDDARRAQLALQRAAANCESPFTAAIYGTFIHPTVAFAPEQAAAEIAATRALGAPLGNDIVDGCLAAHAGFARFAVGDHDNAALEWRRAVDLGRRAGSQHLEFGISAMLAARAPTLTGEDPTELLTDIIDRLHRFRLGAFLYWALTGLADWWAAGDRLEDAARIIGFLDHEDPGGNQSIADVRVRATEAVDAHPDAAPWRAEGAAMTRDDIVAYCLEQLDAG